MEGRLGSLFKDLRAHLEPASAPDEQAAVRRAHRNLENRRHALAYDQANALAQVGALRVNGQWDHYWTNAA